MKRLRLREWLLLILPVLCLAGAAFYWQTRDVPPRPDTGKFRLVVTKTEFAPLTPREAALGYDRKLVINVEQKGVLPLGAGFKSVAIRVVQAKIENLNGQPCSAQYEKLSLPSRLNYSFQDDSDAFVGYVVKEKAENRTVQKIFFLLRTRQFSEKDAPLRLNCKLKGSSYHRFPVRSSLPAGGSWVFPASVARQRLSSRQSLSAMEMTTFTDCFVTVREKAEQIAVPDISRSSPITFAGSELEGSREQAIVNVTVQHHSPIAGRPGKVRWRVNELHLQDEKGRNYDWVIDSQNPSGAGWIAAGWGGAKDGKFKFHWTVSLDKVPRKVGALTLKCKISANESWPLDILVVVRPEWESRWFPKALQLKRTTLQPTGKPSRFLARVHFSYTGTKPLIHDNDELMYPYRLYDDKNVMLRPSLLNRIEDEKGRVYQKALINVESVEQTEGTNDWTITYDVIAAELPPGHSYFCKVDIGADKIGILPVSIPLPRAKSQ